MVDGRAFMLIAHTAGAAGTPTRVTAAALRVARRAIKVAESLVLPVVTLIDTDGALLSGEAENAAIGGEISRSLSLLTSVETTVVSVIAGRGTGGAALAWFPADVALAATESWLGPIAPEAASLILHRSRDRAREMADLQGVGSAELCEAGIVDAVYRWEDLVDATLCALDDLKALPRESRGTKRRLKFASIG
jgi:acetyl-CoA carboxylase carboxyl transferase subunit beta